MKMPVGLFLQLSGLNTDISAATSYKDRSGPFHDKTKSGHYLHNKPGISIGGGYTSKKISRGFWLLIAGLFPFRSQLELGGNSPIVWEV